MKNVSLALVVSLWMAAGAQAQAPDSQNQGSGPGRVVQGRVTDERGTFGAIGAVPASFRCGI